MFKVMTGGGGVLVRGINHVQSDGRGVRASTMFKVMEGGAGASAMFKVMGGG